MSAFVPKADIAGTMRVNALASSCFVVRSAGGARFLASLQSGKVTVKPSAPTADFQVMPTGVHCGRLTLICQIASSHFHARRLGGEECLEEFLLYSLGIHSIGTSNLAIETPSVSSIEAIVKMREDLCVRSRS